MGITHAKFHQQMAVLQNQWRLNGRKIVDEMRAISVRKICTLCNKPKVRTYDLCIVIPESAKKRKIVRKW